jgi:GNAT superfamily N-acetyltransferase
MTLLLRPLQIADHAQVWDVRYAVTENTLTPGKLTNDDLRRETEQTGRGWVVEEDGRIVAFAIGNGRTGNVWALFVRPEAQGRGHGHRLHEQLLRWFATQPVPRLWLTTGADTRARGFYERRGWHQVATTPSGEVRLERDNTAPATVAYRVHDDLPQPQTDAVDAGLGQGNDAAAPLGDVRPLSCFAHAGDGSLLGGAVGRTWGVCCELQQLWVPPHARGQGIGRGLLQRFEQRATERGCTTFYLETFSFQAPGLYHAMGYEVAAAIEGFGQGITKFVMVKRVSVK